MREDQKMKTQYQHWESTIKTQHSTWESSTLEFAGNVDDVV